MKEKKAVLFCIIMLSMFSFLGCVQEIPLTEKESDLISRYAAGKILESSELYDARLAVLSETPEDGDLSGESIVEPTQSPSPAQTALPSGAAVSSETTVTTGSVVSSEVTASSGSGNPSKTDSSESMVKVSLDDIYKISGLRFSYKAFEFCSEYSGKDDSYGIIMANQDEVLLVVKFQVKNITEKTISVNLIKRDKISYPLETKNGSFSPSISFLKNGGLNFLKAKIKGGKSEEAILIYSIPKKVRDIKDLVLKVQENQKEAIVVLK